MAQSGRVPARIGRMASWVNPVARKPHLLTTRGGSHPLQTVARMDQLGESFLKRLAPLLMLGDNVIGRPGKEIVVAEFRLDLGDLGPHFDDLVVEANALGRQIDEAGQRQSDHFAANQKLEGAGGRGRRRFDSLHASESLDTFAPRFRAPGGAFAGGHEYERRQRRGRNAHLGPHRADFADQIDDPADLGFDGLVDRKALPSATVRAPAARRALDPSSPLIAQSSSVTNGMNGCSIA